MNKSFAAEDAIAKSTWRFRLSLGCLGLLLSVLLIGNGIVFQTYLIYVPNPILDAHRMFGTPFLLTEAACIIAAMANGMSFTQIWHDLSKTNKILVLVFLSTFWVGGIFYSETVPLASIANIATLLHIAFAVSLGHLIGNINSTSIDKLALLVTGGMAIFALMIAKVFIFHPPLSTFPKEVFQWQFAVPGFISVRLFGAFCGALLTFIVFLTIDREKSHNARHWHFIAVALIAGMLIWSGTRAALVGFATAALCGAYFFRVRISAKTFAKLLLCFTAATVAATLLIPYDDCTFSFICSGDYSDANVATGGRLYLWEFYARSFLDYPLFGAGPFSASWLAPDGPIKHVQPHNVVLQFLMNWGVIASAAAFALLAVATRRAHNITLAQPHLTPFLMMLYCLLAMSMFDGIFFFARDTMLIMLSYGIIFAADRQVKLP